MNAFKMVARFLMLVTMHVTLFGCGSGGGDGAPVTNKTRALQAGDSWTYDSSSQPQLNSQNIPFSYTTTITITQETLNGESVLTATSLMNSSLNGSNTTFTAVDYYQQDPSTGDILAYGHKTGNNPLITVTDRPLPVAWPGSWEAGKTITQTIHSSDSSTDQGSLTVIGQETITTPAGTFSTWKCTINTGSESVTVWFSPQLGNYVKFELTSGTDIFSTTRGAQT